MTSNAYQVNLGVFSWLKPDKNPFYLITIAAVFTLSYSATKNYEIQNWNFLYYLVGFVIIINLGLSLFPQEIDDAQYAKNLRFARSFGIATATLSLVFLEDVLKDVPNTKILYFILIQVIIFSLYLFIGIIKKSNSILEGKKKINNFQLCLTTSSLLIGVILNYNSPPLKITEKVNLPAITDIVNVESNTENSLDSSINNYQEELKPDNIALSKGDKTNDTDCQYSVYKLLLFAWFVCIIAWIYQLRGVFNIKFNSNNSVD